MLETVARGSGHLGINNNSTMTGIAITQTVVAERQAVNITTLNAGDEDGDSYILRCGSSSGAEISCNSTSTAAGDEATCGFTTHGLTPLYTRLTVTSMTATMTQSNNDTIDADNTQPQFTGLGMNDTDIRVNDSVMFYAAWSDIGSAGLDKYIFSWNDSGIWTNTTSSLAEWSNITRSVFSTRGKSIGWMIYANDSVGTQTAQGYRQL